MSTSANEEDNCTITYFYTPDAFNLKFNSHLNINDLQNHNLFFCSYLLVNIGLLSLTSVIMTNSSDVTVNVPSVASNFNTRLHFKKTNVAESTIFLDFFTRALLDQSSYGNHMVWKATHPLVNLGLLSLTSLKLRTKTSAAQIRVGDMWYIQGNCFIFNVKTLKEVGFSQKFKFFLKFNLFGTTEASIPPVFSLPCRIDELAVYIFRTMFISYL